MNGRPDNKLILASASPRRLELLASIAVTPDQIIPADIDETPLKSELPGLFAKRMAIEKAKSIQADYKDSYILAADTVVAVGRRILGKPQDAKECETFLNLLSGRAHRVYTGVCLITPKGKIVSRIVETRLKFKRLSDNEKRDYIKSNEWQGKAGAYGIQGFAGAFISHLSGSYTNVVGLPLYEVRNMLIGTGYINA